MNMYRRTLFLAGVGLFSSKVSLAGEVLTLGGVTLLQPEGVIGPRVKSVEALAGYLKRIQAAAQVYFNEHPSADKTSGYIVIAVKPTQQSNVWLDLSPKMAAEAGEEFKQHLRKVLPMPVADGPVLFALQIGLNGAAPPASGRMPMPEEWAAEGRSAGRALEASEMAVRAWRR